MKTLHTSLTALCLASIAAMAAGCSTAETAASAPATAASPSEQKRARPEQGRGQGGGAVPGVTGQIAEVTDTTMQVQGDAGQTAVTWTAETTFTKQVAGSVADVVAGVCVMAVGSDEGAAISRLRLTPAVDGECSMGMARFGGDGGLPEGFDVQAAPGGMPMDRPSGMPSGMPTDMPSGMPTDMPSGMPSGMPNGEGMRMGSMVVGLVTAVDGTAVTVSQETPGSDEPTEKTFTISDDVAITTTGTATDADVVVGACVSALGEADDTGAVTAATVSLSEATDGECGGGPW